MNIASRPNSVRAFRAWWIAAALVVAGGCQMPYSPAQTTPVRRTSPDQVENPCAERLGEICTRLLLYYARSQELPARLEDLAATGPKTPLRLTCPVSGLAYPYYREGVSVAGSERRIVVQDATPCHAGTRWVIAADPAKPGRARVIQVLRLSATAQLSEK
ncbi:MAG: hypothetical protein WCK05_01400 [Planctomycetota bacterium]|jgi:hypothetical protein